MFVSIFREGSRPSGKPKAEATGLAPEKSADYRNPPKLGCLGGFFSLVLLTYFYGEVQEAEALGIKRDDRPQGVSDSSVSAGMRQRDYFGGE